MRAMKPLVVMLAVLVLASTGCSSARNKLSSSSWKFWKKDKSESAIANSTAPAYQPTLPSATVQPGSSMVAGTTGYPYNAVSAGSGTKNPFPAPGTYQPPAATPSYSTQTASAYNSSTYGAASGGTSYGYQPPTATQGTAAMAPQSGYYDAGSQWGTPAASTPPATSYGASAYTATAPAGYNQESPSSYSGLGYGAATTASGGAYTSPAVPAANPYVMPSTSASAEPAASAGSGYPAVVTPPATMPQVTVPATATMPQVTTPPTTAAMPQHDHAAHGSSTRSEAAYVPGQSDYTPGSGYAPAGVQPYSSPTPAYQSPANPTADPNYYPGASGDYRPGGTGTYSAPGTSSTTPADTAPQSSGPVSPASHQEDVDAAS